MRQRADSAPQAPEIGAAREAPPLTKNLERARHEPASETPTLLTADEAAMRLRVSRRTLERERLARRLGCVRIRARVFYTPGQLAAYAAAQAEQNENEERRTTSEQCPATKAQR